MRTEISLCLKGQVVATTFQYSHSLYSGRTEYRVQTLSGLACLSHTASDIEKALAINSSTVRAIQYS